VRLKNAGQIIGGVSSRTIWALADSESKTAFTRFPASERRSAPARQVASPPDLSIGPTGPRISLGFTVGPVVPWVTGKRRCQLPHDVVHVGLLVARGKENVWDNLLYSKTTSSPYYSLATPLLCVYVCRLLDSVPYSPGQTFCNTGDGKKRHLLQTEEVFQ
jgi:hypothetical protein